jgi:SAM-dependent methyltransferase
VGPFWHFNGVERAAPPMMGPRQWEKWVVPYDGEIMRRIKAADPSARIHVHCHGKVRTLLDSFVEMGYVRDIRTLQTRLARGANILEIGCSSGEFMALAVRAGHAACGVEADPDACAKARAAGLNVFCGTIEEYAPVGQYDAVYSSHVIEHLESPVLVAGKIFDLLKPGGWLLAEVPNQLANAYVRRDRWLRRLPQRVRSGWSIHHLHFFSPATFRRLFADRGFEITWVKTFDQNPVSLLRRAIRWTTRLTFGGGATLIQVLARRPA